MHPLDQQFWYRYQRLWGTIAIVIGAGAWGMELAGTVYICPYCRVQRTVILLLGCIMLLPSPRHWFWKYLASVMGFFGAVVAVNQNFMGWVKISKGEFSFNEQLYVDPFLLSAGSLFILIGQLWLILGANAGPTTDKGRDESPAANRRVDIQSPVEAQLLAMQRSLSWRLTYPLRLGADWLLIRPINGVRYLGNKALAGLLNTLGKPIGHAMHWLIEYPSLANNLAAMLARFPHLRRHLIAIFEKHRPSYESLAEATHVGVQAVNHQGAETHSVMDARAQQGVLNRRLQTQGESKEKLNARAKKIHALIIAAKASP